MCTRQYCTHITPPYTHTHTHTQTESFAFTIAQHRRVKLCNIIKNRFLNIFIISICLFRITLLYTKAPAHTEQLNDLSRGRLDDSTLPFALCIEVNVGTIFFSCILWFHVKQLKQAQHRGWPSTAAETLQQLHTLVVLLLVLELHHHIKKIQRSFQSNIIYFFNQNFSQNNHYSCFNDAIANQISWLAMHPNTDYYRWHKSFHSFCTAIAN